MFVLVFCLVLVRVSKKESGLIKEQASKDRLLKACESTPLIMRGTYLQSTPQLCLWSEVDESSRAYLSALYTRVPTILHTRNNSISPNTPIDGVPLIHASNSLASRTCINRWISLQLSQIQTHCDDIHHTSNPATRMSPLIPADARNRMQVRTIPGRETANCFLGILDRQRPSYWLCLPAWEM
jgi:hypothetical protein